ncbi:hypothetical protein K1T71_011658 [Dendrolimus kikuchii]|uniref:Uncharacterized protein n=1 Tax=Dendrolimus kikuchii TaxID=765133 RepID=A0ACC1CLN9_9NEOP|nr:hypothetical protein K1T71_011658 [Dendrolimus kikuchii]
MASNTKMFLYCLLLCFVANANVLHGNPSSNDILNDQQLLFAMAINRHGERSPDSDEASLSDDPERIRNITYIEGPEGLTNVGKRRAYQIGKFYRQRYGSQGHNLISNLYFRDEIALRSTEKERTKMTIMIAMAAAYPPEVEQQWDEGVGKVWQPVPYSAVPISEDYLRYYSNCKRFKQLMAEAKEEAIHNEFAVYDDLIPFLKQKTGRNFTEDPLLFETLFDLFRSLVGLGLDIPTWATPLLPRLGEAARLSYRLYFRNNEMKKIGGGVLLNTFVQAALDIIAGTPVNQRLRIFSAHDFNIGALMDVAKVKNNHSIPEYGSVFALELYRSRSTGAYSVLPVYLPQAGESSAQTFSFEGCESSTYCDFNKFMESTKDFLLPESEFYKLCDIKTEL